jgi:hypothetical protein
MRRRLLAFARYVLFLVAVVATVAVVLHWRWARSVTPARFMADRKPMPCCDAAMVARLGRLDGPRPGSFQVVPLEKRPGVVRIGCFGDSFTYGLEVADGLDFPAQLEQQLRAHGASQVEVVNFGTSGFGFHQMQMTMELVAPRFAVDVAVSAPLLDFWWLRDGTFAQWPPPSETLSIHGRYVLAGDDVRLVDPVGISEAEQYRTYVRLVPPLRYLRYDRRAPAFLQAWLPAGRELPNPFFYGADDEVMETYRRLLRRQLAGPPSIVLDRRKQVERLIGAETDPRRVVLQVDVPERFPYLAPQNHWSAWGNRLVADHALRAFDVGASGAVDVLETSADAPAASVARERGLPPHDGARVLVSDRVVGSAYRYEPGVWKSPRVAAFPEGTAALIALAAPGQALVDALFVPLARRPVDEVVTAEVDGTEKRVALAMAPRWVADGIARLDLCDGQALAVVAKTKVAGRCIVPVPWDQQRPSRAITIRLGDEVLAIVDASIFGVVVRSVGPAYKLRADADLPANPAGLPERGEVALLLSAAGAPVAHVPLGRFHRVARPLDLGVRRLALVPHAGS